MLIPMQFEDVPIGARFKYSFNGKPCYFEYESINSIIDESTISKIFNFKLYFNARCIANGKLTMFKSDDEVFVIKPD